MFERNRVDNANDPTVAIEVGLAGGATITGRAALGKGKPLHRLLDGDEKFLFVDCFEGEAQFVAKAEITSVIGHSSCAIPMAGKRQTKRPIVAIGLLHFGPRGSCPLAHASGTAAVSETRAECCRASSRGFRGSCCAAY